MKRAILSDIHGNLPALESVLAHASQLGVDEYIFTGDMVGHGPNPEGCIERLRTFNIIGIKGNNDKVLLTNDSNHDFYQVEANISLKWAKDQLSSESLDWLKRQLSDSALLLNQFLTVVHGTLMDPTGDYTYMYDNDSNIKMSLRSLKTSIGLFGHTHRPVIYMALPKPPPFLFSFITTIPKYTPSGDIGEYVFNYAEDVEMGKKILACAGSIGQPRDRDSRTSYLIIDDKKNELQYFRIPYDLQAVFDDFEKIRAQYPKDSEIIDDCIRRLEQGI